MKKINDPLFMIDELKNYISKEVFHGFSVSYEEDVLDGIDDFFESYREECIKSECF